MKHSFCAKENQTLIDAVSQNIGGITLPAIKSLLKAGEVRLNGKKQCKNCMVSIGDTVSVFVPVKYQCAQTPQIIFADDNIVIVDKPPFFDVENNLLSAVRQNYPAAQAVHRLDRNTVGLVVFAQNPAAYLALTDAFRTRSIHKYYVARVHGFFDKAGQHTAYLKKDSEKSEVKISDTPLSGYKKIVTEFEPITKGETSTVGIKLVTGRTHQIRAHLAHLGNPVLGDGRYGQRDDKTSNQKHYALTAKQLTFWGLRPPLEYINGKTFQSVIHSAIGENAIGEDAIGENAIGE